ncbi:ribose-5-phosphate isomerase [Candidatus Daviesbacteria bacterium RIFCSPLOWO2_01_FULL_39_12]|uniref:Ribose-5-phosphate isomerase n=1 Tax=Candidatus Daviesbacteria bacterium RIFCSPLOWO2_01_FULL_39_12 TaxID=1797785 RepID=A0A1F5KNG2_9BACT|nr:MAG: ribose-5-phosphate isomerase [Candidatus Daviesbacteria bacterium RIFCSPHIGHO2_02_FULL_39_8]OGE42384.1 MAG: ribose-5-phosphate isomerase [Candidatus Daviesbacteria bacterium RIFCSPLOWO2_01_FULL_39_12]
MMIYLATDHAGFALKEKVKKYLQDLGYGVEDFGAYRLDPDDDYPDFISKAAEAVSKDPQNRAVILGGSGQGEAMVANKFPNVRAVVYYGGMDVIPLTREHNNANILSLGARFLTEDEAIEAVKLWLETPFTEEERHIRRIEKIKKIEELL